MTVLAAFNQYVGGVLEDRFATVARVIQFIGLSLHCEGVH